MPSPSGQSKVKPKRSAGLNSGDSGKDDEDEEDKTAKEDEINLPLEESPVLEWMRAFWRCSTALVIMMWLYLPPNTPSAISCLLQGPEMAFVGMLISCQGTDCSGWFHTHSPLPPNLGLIAVAQMAIGTSVLWMWLGVMSVIGLYRPKSKGKSASAKKARILSWRLIGGCFRSLSQTLRKLIVYGQAMGLLSVIVVSLTVFITVVMQVLTGDTGETLGSVCCGPLILLSSQGFSPGPEEIKSKKRGLRLVYRTYFCPVLLPVKLFGKCTGSRRKTAREHRSDR